MTTPQPSEDTQPKNLTPQPNTIVFTPATVEACASDYAAAAAVRAEMDKQQARQR